MRRQAGGDAAACATKDPVSLQLKWVAQAQFAGYYAAQGEGYYDDECLEITINSGGPDLVPEQVVAGGQADFGINFVPSLLSAREQGTNLVNIAQVFERSAMREISWKDTGIQSPADLKGKKVAVWFGGNEFELLATLAKAGIDKDKDVELIQQPFDMNLLLERQVDAAAAMTYNELAQVLETENPATGELHKLDELNIIDFNAEGTAMLQDGVFTTEEWLKDAKNQDIAARFLRASFKGWMFCRDNPDKCVDYVLEQGPALPRGHQTWMMNEVNALIWPSTAGIGQMDSAHLRPDRSDRPAVRHHQESADRRRLRDRLRQAGAGGHRGGYHGQGMAAGRSGDYCGRAVVSGHGWAGWTDLKSVNPAHPCLL